MAPTPCSQCGKPAVAETADGLPLCLQCFQILHEINRQQWEMHAAIANLAAADMESAVGMPGVLPRIQIPPRTPIVNSGPVNLHNIRVDRSIIGAINTGEVQRIDVNLTNLHNAGNDAASDALKALTEATLVEKSLNDAQKNELIEQIAFLSSQAIAEPPERKPGMIKAAMAAIGATTAMVGGLVDLWLKAEPILKQIFGT